MIDIDAIEKRAQEAAKGPWSAYCDGSYDLHWWGGKYGDHIAAYVVQAPPGGGYPRARICEFLANGPEAVYQTGSGEIRIGTATAQDIANVEFVANAREDVPALCAEVKNLRLALGHAKYCAVCHESGWLDCEAGREALALLGLPTGDRE